MKLGAQDDHCAQGSCEQTMCPPCLRLVLLTRWRPLNTINKFGGCAVEYLPWLERPLSA